MDVICADVLAWARGYEGPKFHALLCDPPWHLRGGFMGRYWDRDGDDAISFQAETWAALAEHLWPGAFLFVFGGSRGWHRLACAMEDAGLLIQPSLFIWLQAQAFPKATRIDTAIDKAAGKLGERKVIRKRKLTGNARVKGSAGGIPGNYLGAHRGTGYLINNIDDGQVKEIRESILITAPATDLARAWQGHRYGGQVLKDCATPIIVAQKPWEGKRLDCIVETGAGALWVDGGRIGFSDDGDGEWHSTPTVGQQGMGDKGTKGIYGYYGGDGKLKDNIRYVSKGRWPANFALVHSPGCRRVGVRRVRGSAPQGKAHDWENGKTSYCGGFQEKGIAVNYADPDGLETVADWRCEPDCVVARLGGQSGIQDSRPGATNHEEGRTNTYGWANGGGIYKKGAMHNDKGTAARFYAQADWHHEIAERLATSDPVRYQPKAAKKERNNGLDDFYWQKEKGSATGFVRVSREEWEALGEEEERIRAETGRRVSLRAQGNIHPTVKPISLCEWLARLLLPPKEYAPRRILVPFAGTGSEGIGAYLADWEEVVMVELLKEHCEMAEARSGFWAERGRQLELWE